VADSPISQLLDAVRGLDAEIIAAQFAPDGKLLTVDGQRAQGREAIRGVLAEFLGTLRSTTHRITAQWHEDDAWIAEVEASYELRDSLRLKSLPRAFVLREGPDGIADLRIYGAHERPLTDSRAGGKGIWIGDRWIPPL
jgi:hypothetical protein